MRPVPVRLVAVLAAAAALWLGSAPVASAAGRRLDVVSTVVGPDRRVDVVVAAPGELLGAEVPGGGFSVFENGQPRPVEVRRVTTENLDVVLVVDVSGSMAGAALAAAKAAAVEFVDRLPVGTRVGLVSFGASARVASPFSDDRHVIIRAVNNLKAAGETALYDALAMTVDQLLGQAGPRRSVVVLSDGGDTVSRSTLDDVAARLPAAGAEVFAVALATAETDTAVLARLAGGETRVVAADNPAGLAGAYRAVAAQLVNRYELRFTAEGGGRTEVRIALDAGGVQAEAVRTVELPARPAVIPAPTPVVAATPGLLGGRWTLVVGGLSFAVAFGLAGWLLVSPGDTRRRLAREWAPHAERGGALADFSERATGAVDRVLAGGDRSTAVNRALDQAGIALRPGGFVLLALSSSWTAGAAGFLLAGPVIGVFFAGLTLAGFWAAVTTRIRRRQARFSEQLGDTVQLLAGGLRAGYGLIQAVDGVAREAEAPTSDEFRRVVVENRLGRDLTDSLRAVSDRMANHDFEWVVQAIGIHREIGGDLAEVLDNIGETIRDRHRIRRQVKALSAEGRLSAVILFVLPFAVAAVVTVTNPDYLGEFIGRTGGRVMLITAAALMCVGGVWLRRLVRLRF